MFLCIVRWTAHELGQRRSRMQGERFPVKGKHEIKLSHSTPWRRREERIYTSCSFKTLALEGGKRSASRPGRALLPGKGPPVPVVQEAEWALEPVWTQRLEEKSFCLCRGSNPDCPVVQSIIRRYTDSYPGSCRYETVKQSFWTEW
jgi:hypothetical protein